MRRIKRKEEEGAMGVGTLIVFIAMVLVAAVAASVLINTAKKLQQQAEKTGDQAIREVSSSFIVKDVFAYDASDDNEVETLVMKVGLAAGAPAQNLNQTVIQVQNNSAEANLIAASSQGTTPGSSNYAWTPIIEQEADEDQYLEQGDLVNITINLTATLGGDGVGTQDDVSLHIIPKHGTPSYEEFTTPPVMTTRIIDL